MKQINDEVCSEKTTLPTYMREQERLYLEQVLRLAGGNKTKASKIAGVSVQTLSAKISKYNITACFYLS